MTDRDRSNIFTMTVAGPWTHKAEAHYDVPWWKLDLILEIIRMPDQGQGSSYYQVVGGPVYTEKQIATARADAFEEAAAEAATERIMFLTEENIKSGMLEDSHPIIKARKQMRSEIYKALIVRAAELREEGERK